MTIEREIGLALRGAALAVWGWRWVAVSRLADVLLAPIVLVVWIWWRLSRWSKRSHTG